MEAAHLVPVPDRIDRGASWLPKADGEDGPLVSPSSLAVKSAESELPAGDKGFGWDSPTPAINSGKELDKSMLGPSHSISNGSGRLYEGSPDHDEDERTLEAQRLVSAGGYATEPFHAENETK